MNRITDIELVAHIDTVIKNYRGNSEKLSNAIGVYMLARHLGWRPTFLLHSIKTIKMYESILGLKFQETTPEINYKSEKLVAWVLAKKVSNFWKLVKGEVANVRTKDWSMME